MRRTDKWFTGVNNVCAQCVQECKQYEQVTLVNCPKFSTKQTDKPCPSRRGKRPRMQNKGVNIGK